MAMGRRGFFSCLILGLVIKPTVPAAGTVNLSVARWRSDYMYISRDWFTASHFYSIWRSTTRLFRRGPAWLPCLRSPSWIRPQVLGWIILSLRIFLKVFFGKNNLFIERYSSLTWGPRTLSYSPAICLKTSPSSHHSSPLTSKVRSFLTGHKMNFEVWLFLTVDRRFPVLGCDPLQQFDQPRSQHNRRT